MPNDRQWLGWNRDNDRRSVREQLKPRIFVLSMKNDGHPNALYFGVFPKVVRRVIQQNPLRTLKQVRVGYFLGKAFKNSKNQRDEKAIGYFNKVFSLASEDETYAIMVDAYLAKARSHDRLGQSEEAKQCRTHARQYEARIKKRNPFP